MPALVDFDTWTSAGNGGTTATIPHPAVSVGDLVLVMFNADRGGLSMSEVDISSIPLGPSGEVPHWLAVENTQPQRSAQWLWYYIATAAHAATTTNFTVDQTFGGEVHTCRVAAGTFNAEWPITVREQVGITAPSTTVKGFTPTAVEDGGLVCGALCHTTYEYDVPNAPAGWTVEDTADNWCTHAWVTKDAAAVEGVAIPDATFPLTVALNYSDNHVGFTVNAAGTTPPSVRVVNVGKREAADNQNNLKADGAGNMWLSHNYALDRVRFSKSSDGGLTWVEVPSLEKEIRSANESFDWYIDKNTNAAIMYQVLSTAQFWFCADITASSPSWVLVSGMSITGSTGWVKVLMFPKPSSSNLYVATADEERASDDLDVKVWEITPAGVLVGTILYDQRLNTSTIPSAIAFDWAHDGNGYVDGDPHLFLLDSSGLDDDWYYIPYDPVNYPTTIYDDTTYTTRAWVVDNSSEVADAFWDGTRFVWVVKEDVGGSWFFKIHEIVSPYTSETVRSGPTFLTSNFGIDSLAAALNPTNGDVHCFASFYNAGGGVWHQRYERATDTWHTAEQIMFTDNLSSQASWDFNLRAARYAEDGSVYMVAWMPWGTNQIKMPRVAIIDVEGFGTQLVAAGASLVNAFFVGASAVDRIYAGTNIVYD